MPLVNGSRSIFLARLSQAVTPGVIVPGVGLLTRFDVSTSSAVGHGLIGGGHTTLLIGGLEVCLLGICLCATAEPLDRAVLD